MENIDYVGKIAIYTNPDTNIQWLMKIDLIDYKRCTGDMFEHTYLSGTSILIDSSKEKLTPISDMRTGTYNVHPSSIKLVDATKDLTSLFD